MTKKETDGKMEEQRVGGTSRSGPEGEEVRVGNMSPEERTGREMKQQVNVQMKG